MTEAPTSRSPSPLFVRCFKKLAINGRLMASALVNTTAAAVADRRHLDVPSAALLSPRISFSHDDSPAPVPDTSGSADPEAPVADLSDFEFRLDDDPVAMLPADELFSNGKLIPLQPAPSSAAAFKLPDPDTASPDPPDPISCSSSSTVAAISPRAPRCSSRWRELLGLKRLHKASRNPDPNPRPASSPSSLKLLLYKSPRSAAADSISTVPLLREQESEPQPPSTLKLLLRGPKPGTSDSAPTVSPLRDPDSEPASFSSSTSSSLSSVSTDPEELPRLSLDSGGKPGRHQDRVRISRQQSSARARIPRRGAGPAGESPRMSASGRVVFASLERSSSSPAGSLRTGRARAVMERSNSAHVVRVTPVLNVPVCRLRPGSGRTGSVFGLGQLFSSSPQKKDREASRNLGKGKTEKKNDGD